MFARGDDDSHTAPSMDTQETGEHLVDAVHYIREKGSLHHEETLAQDRASEAGRVTARARAGSDAALLALEDEPIVTDTSSLDKWHLWAESRAKAHADRVHPRLETEDGAPRLVPLDASMATIEQVVGLAPRLFFDFLRLCSGLCFLGFLSSLPSLSASVASYSSVYANGTLAGPAALAALSIGGRLDCHGVSGAPIRSLVHGDECAGVKWINFLAALFEVGFTLVVFFALRAFRHRMGIINEQGEAHHALVSEYSVCLYGLPSDATPLHVKAHLETALRKWVMQKLKRLKEPHWSDDADPRVRQRKQEELEQLEKQVAGPVPPWQVHDVTMILDYGSVLRARQRLAPLQQKLDRAKARLQQAQGRGHLSAKSIKALTKAESLAQKRFSATSQKLEHLDFSGSYRACGAFVTFETQVGCRSAMEAFDSGLISLFAQPAYLRYPISGPPLPAVRAAEANLAHEIDDQAVADAMAIYETQPLKPAMRLRAYPASHPEDCTFENVPYELGRLPAKAAVFTLCRRIFSRTILVLVLAISAILIVAIKSSADDLQTRAQQLATEQGAAAAAPQLFVKQATAAVNAGMSAIPVLVVLFLTETVGFLANFERHSTFSAREEVKTRLLTISAFLSLGFVALLVGFGSSRRQRNIFCPFCPERAGLEGLTGQTNGTAFCCLLGPDGLLLRSDTIDLSADWHIEVGAVVAFSMILQIFIGAAAPLVGAAVSALRRRLLLKSRVTVEDVLALHTGPAFNVPGLISKAISFFAVVLMYSAAVPLLYLVGFVYFASQYLLLKWAVLRVWQRPPQYSYKLLHGSMGLLQFSVALHALLGWWAYSESPGFPLSGDTWYRPLLGGSERTDWFSGSGFNWQWDADGFGLVDHINSWWVSPL